MLGGGVEIFVYHDAGAFVIDAGVFESVVEERLGAGSDNDSVNADHLFGVAVHEDDDFGAVVFGDLDDFGIGDDSDAEFARQKIGESSGDFLVFTGEDVVGALHDDDADTEHGEEFGDFDTGGTTAGDKDELGWAANGDSVVWIEIFDGFKTGDFAGF